MSDTKIVSGFIDAIRLAEHTGSAHRSVETLRALVELSPDGIIAAILTIANTTNLSVNKLNNFVSQFEVYGDIHDSITVGNLSDLRLILKQEVPRNTLIHVNTLKMLDYISSPKAWGLLPSKVRYILAPSTLSYVSAMELLKLHVDLEQEYYVKVCSVCGRPMASVNDTGACQTCRSDIVSYTHFRVAPFVVPISSLNITHFGMHVDGEVEIHIGAFKVVKEANSLVYTYAKPLVPLLEVPLPFEEYAKPIL